MTVGRRELFVLRHAKSAWPAGVADRDRPLNARGERSAAVIGAYLAANGLLPDHIACSPARRAVDTARLALAAAGSARAAQVDARLYEGDVFQVVRALPAAAARVLLVGHEPELVELVRELCGADVRMPTAALAVMAVEGGWDELGAGRAVLELLVTPKLLASGRWTTVSAGT